MILTSLLRTAIDWLREGDPARLLPGPDRVPLLALLRNPAMSDAEIDAVVREITASQSEAAGVIDRYEIEEFIEAVTRHDGGPENIQRVAAKLLEVGWQLDSGDQGRRGTSTS